MGANRTLTDLAIQKAKPPAKGVRKLSAGAGLQLWVYPNGAKLWRMAYRFAGKQRVLSGEAYRGAGREKVWSLADAQEWRDRELRVLATGFDPGVAKRQRTVAAKIARTNTFAAVADALLALRRRENRAEKTLEKKAWLIGLATRDIGDRPLPEIGAPEILAILKKVEERGKLETARKLRATIGEVFRYGQANALCSVDPTTALKGAIARPTVKGRAAVREPEAVGGLMRAIAGYEGQPETRIALQLLSHTFVRPGELRGGEWPEISGTVWTIPAPRMKGRVDHKVPLSKQALALIEQLHRLTGGGRFMFPSTRTRSRPMSDNTLNAALRRIGYGGDIATAHGFRSTASTLLNESNEFHPDAIERALAHKEADEIRGAYDKSKRWKERVRMAQWWSDKLDGLRDGVPRTDKLEKQAF